MNSNAHKPIIVAFDVGSMDEAVRLADTLHPSLCRAKVGKELFTSEGPAVVRTLTQKGYEVFLDLKFKDIPNTVANAAYAAAQMGVWMINLHADGGRKMMAETMERLAPLAYRPLVVAVTVLTSMDANDLRDVGVSCSDGEADSVLPQVLRLARLARDAGLDGVVASAREASAIRTEIGDGFATVTPGIRLPEGAQNDQKRVLSPEDAVQAGADYLVVGRPITQAPEPMEALEIFHARATQALKASV